MRAIDFVLAAKAAGVNVRVANMSLGNWTDADNAAENEPYSAKFPSWLPWPRIILDHVLFTKGLDASDVSSFCVEGSDHLALVATLTLK